MKIFKVAVVLLVAGAFLGTTAYAAIAPKPIVTPRANLVVNIQTTEIQKVMMGLRLANTMLDKGKRVTVYLNIEGVQNAWAGLPKNIHTATGKTVTQALTDILNRGATVAVCQMCMNQYGITQAELIPGAILSSPDFAYGLYLDTYSHVVTY